MPLVCWEVIGCSDGGCWKVLGGVDTHKGTTNFKVVESPLTLKELEEKFFASIKAQKWINDPAWKLPEMTWRVIAKRFAGAIARAASRFPPNDVVSKRGCTFWSRKNPKRAARIIIRFTKRDVQ